jgi:hypothetical protein
MRRLANSPWLILLVAMMVLLPPYVSTGFNVSEILQINSYILTHSIKHDYAAVFPLSNIIALLVLSGVYLAGQRLNRVFSAFISFAYLISGLLQNVSISERYGLAICTSTLFLTLLVAGSWLQEFLTHENDFSHRPHHQRIVVLLPLALLALWQPVNQASMLPDFQLHNFIILGSSLTFCMMTIVAICILLAYYPNVNKGTLRVTSIVGLLIGVGNLWLEFIYMPELLWVGVLHIPLVG